jgi:hypothetical protein
MRIDIRTNIRDSKRDLAKLEANIRQRAVARALNRMADQGKVQMVRGIGQEFNLKATEIRSAVNVRRAKEGAFGSLLQATIEAYGSRRGRGFNVTRFRTGRAPVPRKGKNRPQLKFKIKRAGGIKQIPGAFVLNKPGSPVVRRVGKERLPIKGVTTIGIPQMFNTRRINSRVVKFIQDKFPEVLRREIDYYVGRFGR